MSKVPLPKKSKQKRHRKEDGTFMQNPQPYPGLSRPTLSILEFILKYVSFDSNVVKEELISVLNNKRACEIDSITSGSVLCQQCSSFESTNSKWQEYSDLFESTAGVAVAEFDDKYGTSYETIKIHYDLNQN